MAEGVVRTVVAGEPVLLFPERGMVLPGLDTAVVADLHWGKDATFRAAHVPVPSGTTDDDLARLSDFVRRAGMSTLLVLGDLFHARAGRHPDVLAALHAWRAAHADLAIVLVRGNHDTHAGDPPASLDILCVDGPVTIGPFTCTHHPDPIAEAYVLAGHLHPSITVGGRARQRERLCCFAFGPQVGILPAFTSFTGGGAYVPAPDDRVFAIVEHEVMQVR